MIQQQQQLTEPRDARTDKKFVDKWRPGAHGVPIGNRESRARFYAELCQRDLYADADLLAELCDEPSVDAIFADIRREYKLGPCDQIGTSPNGTARYRYAPLPRHLRDGKTHSLSMRPLAREPLPHISTNEQAAYQFRHHMLMENHADALAVLLRWKMRVTKADVTDGFYNHINTLHPALSEMEERTRCIAWLLPEVSDV